MISGDGSHENRGAARRWRAAGLISSTFSTVVSQLSAARIGRVAAVVWMSVAAIPARDWALTAEPSIGGRGRRHRLSPMGRLLLALSASFCMPIARFTRDFLYALTTAGRAGRLVTNQECFHGQTQGQDGRKDQAGRRRDYRGWEIERGG